MTSLTATERAAIRERHKERADNMVPSRRVCGICRYEDGVPQLWPCDAIRLLDAALDAGAQTQ